MDRVFKVIVVVLIACLVLMSLWNIAQMTVSGIVLFIVFGGMALFLSWIYGQDKDDDWWKNMNENMDDWDDWDHLHDDYL